MKFSSLIAPFAVITMGSAQMIACMMNGRELSVVDRETGICEFPISNLLAVQYDYKNSTSFEATAYLYETKDGDEIYNDFAGKTNKFSIPAIKLTEAPKSVEWKALVSFEGPEGPKDIYSEEQMRERLLSSPKIEMPNWSPMVIAGHKVFP